MRARRGRTMGKTATARLSHVLLILQENIGNFDKCTANELASLVDKAVADNCSLVCAFCAFAASCRAFDMNMGDWIYACKPCASARYAENEEDPASEVGLFRDLKNHRRRMGQEWNVYRHR